MNTRKTDSQTASITSCVSTKETSDTNNAKHSKLKDDTSLISKNYEEIEGNLKITIEYKWNKVENSRGTIVASGGTGGGFGGPAKIYDDLALYASNLGLSLLRIHTPQSFHIKGALAVQDVLYHLKEELKNTPMLLMGHSMGGASMIHVAKWAQYMKFQIKGLVTLASQYNGTEPVKELNNVPIFIFHGREDKVLGPRCSESIYERAKEPKKLILLDEAGHDMKESFDTLKGHVFDSIIKSFDIK